MRSVLTDLVIAFIRRGVLVHVYDAKSGLPLNKKAHCGLSDLVGGRDEPASVGWKELRAIQQGRKRKRYR